MKTYIVRHRKAVVMLALILTGIGLGSVFWLLGQKTGLQQGIAGEIIRFHVLANSDSEKDQALKLKVKDGLVAYLKPMLSGADSVEESREILKENLGLIQEEAQNLLAKEQTPYEAKAELTTCYFPIKTYGDCTFPAGNYEALRIRIGEAKGKNWWCVLYPNLCFIDSLHGVVPEEQKQELKYVLTEEEYDSLFPQEKPKLKFFFLDHLFS